VAETICVSDILDRFFDLAKRFISWIMPANEDTDQPDVADSDDNKSPPDLGVKARDSFKAGDSFGRP